MKIEVKIRDKEEHIWSLPVPIEEFITDPFNIQFEWEDGSQLPYKDFIFFGADYEYCLFINNMIMNDYIKHINNLKEKAWKYDDLCD